MSLAVDFAPREMEKIVDCARCNGMKVEEFVKESILQVVNGMNMEIPNAQTIAAIVEGEQIAHDPKVKGYSTMSDLIASLEA